MPPRQPFRNRDPFRLFQAWYQRATVSDPDQPNAMTLATVGRDGAPSARVVLMKAFDQSGVVFFTNYESRKGRELAGESRAALLFWWKGLRRQVRIEGVVTRIPPAESDAYFQSRPRGFRLGAWTSSQSRPLPGRAVLRARYDAAARRFRGKPVPRPRHWGGYRLVPDGFEFWTHRENRLHERLAFRRGAGGGWRMRALYP